MGEVYRAQDLRLGREVAIKVLREELSGGPDRLARFEREARAVAALNHPNIATIYGIEEAEGRTCLILECVDGETLAERLGRGRLPLARALDVGIEVAAGLEAAHAAGVIHRDLKPANLKLTADGKIKILDFGLAKLAFEEAGAEASLSPTVSLAATRAGTLLGTAAYMSPEQARGRGVDKRADIWALGCVLYECLTGRRAFPADTVSDTLVQVLVGEPDWSRLPATTPLKVRDLLRRCLQKDLGQRLHDVADARLELEEARLEPAGEAAAEHRGGRRRWARSWARGLVAVALAAAGALLAWLVTRPGERSFAPHGRFQLQPPLGIEVLRSGASATLAISPDGRWVAFRGGGAAAEPRLYLRRIDEVEARPVTGSEAGVNPFFSPDSRWLGFFARGALRKVSLEGGDPIVICPIARLRGASWGEDDTIVFSAGEGLLRVAGHGGEPLTLTAPGLDEPGVRHYWPHHLPGGRRVLFLVHRGQRIEHEIGVLTLATGEQRTLVRGGGYSRYAGGHLVFGRLGTLYAVAFDPARLAVTGEPRPVLEDVYSYLGSGFVAFDLARNGSLVLVPGVERLREAELVQVDPEGRISTVAGRRAAYGSPLVVSPGGDRIAVVIASGLAESDLWTCELSGERWSRLTTDGKVDEGPAFSPDGRWILFNAVVRGAPKIFRIPADGAGPAEQLTFGVEWDTVNDVSPDGRVLLFQRQVTAAQWDLLTLELDGDRTPRPFLSTPVLEAHGDFSPDGRWIAYESDEAGSREIQIRPYPGAEPRVAVSSGGGWTPQWSQRGDEIHYRCEPRSICTVSLETSSQVIVGPSLRRLELEFLLTPWQSRFTVSADGERLFLVKYPPEDTSERRIVYAPRWTEELRVR